MLRGGSLNRGRIYRRKEKKKYSSLFVILKRCKVQKNDIQGFKLSSLLSWLKCAESRLLLILRSMDASYLSFLRTNDFVAYLDIIMV